MKSGLLVIAAAAVGVAQSTNTTGALLPGLYADPNIAVFGCNIQRQMVGFDIKGNDRWRLTLASGFPGWAGQQFFVWKSSNLRDWHRTGPIPTLNDTDGNVPWATGNAWAPTIIERYGKYYIYFSGQNPTYDRKTIGVAVGESPEGPFVAQPKAMILNNEAVNASQAIDPCALYDPETGKYLLYWGNGNPLMAELGDDMVSIQEDTIRTFSGLTDFREASFVVYREPYYHYTYSIGDTGSPDYRVGYATSPKASGPWTYRGTVLQKGGIILATGSNSVVNVPGTDKWYMAYHHFAIPDGDGTHRVTTVNEVTFDPKTRLMNEVVPTLTGLTPQLVPRQPRPWAWGHRGGEKAACHLGSWGWK